MTWLDLGVALLAVTTTLLLGLDYAQRLLTFSMHRLIPWVLGGWIIMVMIVIASWVEWLRH